MMTYDLSAVDLDVLRATRVLREEHHACTGTAVAGRLGFSKSYVFERIHALAEVKLLEWNTMPGSLRLTDAGEALLDKLSAAPEVEGDPTETAPARRGRSHAS
jgi:Mn-dependent DtxR family transcriptional regulator